MKRKKEVRELQKKPENNKPVLVSPCLLTLTLNVNGLNSPIKRHRQDGWIKTKNKKQKNNKKKQNKTQLYVAYKRLTSALRTQID